MSATPGARRRVEDALGHGLADAQWAAVSAPAEPAAIVAGAGSGKTTVMAARVLWLVQEGLVRPDGVLGLTFTTKAAAELLGRTRRLLARVESVDTGAEADHGDPEISTYHSFAGRLLAEHGLRLGLEPTATVLADGAREQLAARVVAVSGPGTGSLGRSPADVVRGLLSLDDALADLAIDPSALRDDAEGLLRELAEGERMRRLQAIGATMRDTARARIVLADLVEQFRAAKADRQVVDFADQTRLALDLVRSSADVRADLRSRYPVVLLDEFQDTSVAQRLLLQEVFADGHPVTAVGDPCQSIYEWRGASIDNLDRFVEHFPRLLPGGSSAPAPRYSLSDNRRSAPAILDLANEIAAPLRAIHPGVEPLVAAAQSGPGLVECALLGTEGEEAEWIAAEIAGRPRETWGDTLVLARKLETLRGIHRRLRAHGVPTHLDHDGNLLAHPAIAVVRAMLEIVDDPGAHGPIAVVLAGPRWGIDPADIARLGRLVARGASAHPSRSRGSAPPLRDVVAAADPLARMTMLDAIDEVVADVESFPSPRVRERLAAFAAEIRDLRRHRSDPPAQLIDRILAVTGWGAEAQVGPAAEVADRMRAIGALRGLAGRFVDLDGSGSLTAFLARLRDAEEFGAQPGLHRPAPAGAVTLMTVHGAKGLEAGHVIVAGLADGVFPSGTGRRLWTRAPDVVPWRLRADAPPDLLGFPDPAAGPRAKDHGEYARRHADLDAAAERRLAYVAITRARHSCLLTGHVSAPGLAQPRGASPFLAEARAWADAGPGLVRQWARAEDADADADVDADADTHPGTDGASLEVARTVPWPVPLDAEVVRCRRSAATAVGELLSAGARDPDAALVELIGSADARTRAWIEEARVLLGEARSRRGGLDAPRPSSLSASQVIRALADPTGLAVDLRRPMPTAPHPRARLGTRFHAWVEEHYAQAPMLDLDDLPGAADDDVAADADLAMLRDAFARTPYAARQPVAVEAPFTLVIGGIQVRGRIDAVFADGGSFEVVDWKTGRVTDESRWQASLYRLAWSHIAGCDPAAVSAHIVEIATGRVHDIIDPGGTAEVMERVRSGLRLLSRSGDPRPSPPVPPGARPRHGA